MKVEQVKNSTFILVTAGIIVFIALLIGLYSFIESSNNKQNEKELEKFNNTLIEAAINYMEKKESDFSNFVNEGDITLITVNELITYGLIDESMENPTEKEITDFYIKVIIDKNGEFSYKVVG